MLSDIPLSINYQSSRNNINNYSSLLIYANNAYITDSD